MFSRVLWYALAAAAHEQREVALLHCAMKNMSYLNNCTHFIVICVLIMISTCKNSPYRSFFQE